MSRPALLDKLLQAGKWLLKPDLIPVDGTTLKRGAADISVAAEALARSGGGLAVDAKTGKLYVDFSLVPDDQMQAIVLAMVQQGGGLAVDRAGKLYVDFGSMPTEKFEAMLKSIRVPMWLSRALHVYVATTGSDTMNEGRGLTIDKPFRTLQAAVNYVSTTYNMYNYNCYINIIDGDYREGKTIDLPSYTTSSGIIVIQGYSKRRDAVKLDKIRLSKASKYLLRSLSVYGNAKIDYNQAVFCSDAGVISLVDVVLDITDAPTDNGSLHGMSATTGGNIVIAASNDNTYPVGITIRAGKTNLPASIINAREGGIVTYYADITIEGDFSVSRGTFFCETSSQINRSRAFTQYPGRSPIITATGTIIGKRYDASLNSIISVWSNGPDFVPGSEAGLATTGAQYA